MKIQLDVTNLKGFVGEKDFTALLPQLQKAHDDLHSRRGKGSEFTGWLNLPSKTDKAFLRELKTLGEQIRKNSDCIISIGIGGSYIGIRAALDFLSDEQKIPVYYAGHNLSSGYLKDLFTKLKKKRVTVLVISKSGTTTEPAVAFRLVKQFMESKYSAKELKKRIICITDENKGALRAIANKQGYQTFPIADDIGGRFSVLAPVGLVPLAIAGIDIASLIKGAQDAEKELAQADFAQNISWQYAASRFLLYKQKKNIEITSFFYQEIDFIAEWWKQLFGESEGKEGQGIFPASVNFTADLHSMGQLIQEGERNIFETFLIVKDTGHKLLIPKDKDNQDNFNCVAGKNLDWVNEQAYKATAMAHLEGGVPNMTITLPKFDAYSLGQLFYFYEKAVAITGYMMGVNPFNQPGVEAYKSKMFALLGRK